jgi:asparagine synthase (glutamine-hydrolysing)
MVADVPLGAFLSGGIDSSVTVSLMQASSPRPVRTFTIGFDTADYDEAPHAKAVASHLGTDHTEHYVSEEAVLDVVPRIPNAYDEPFGDSSQIPTILLSALTRQHVTVALSGDGGDELFAGYDRYGVSADLWRKLRAVPHSGRVLAGRVLNRVASERLRPIVRAALPLVSTRLRGRDPSYRFEHWAELLGAKTREDVYRFAVSVWKEPQALTGAPEHATVLSDARLHPDFDTLVEQAMYIDLVTYLPDDLLVKVDRASMAASLEARVPFLDHRVVEFAWRLPLHMKVRNGATKWALRQVLARHVPPAITERTKMGFGAPIGVWLRGPLRAWAQSLLDADRLKREGYIDPAPVQRLWEEHTSGVRDWKYMLWMVLTFQAWLEAGGA